MPKIKDVSPLLILIGLLVLNVSSSYSDYHGFMMLFETSPEFLRVLRILLLLWLPCAIHHLFTSLLGIQSKKILYYTLWYSGSLSIVYLATVLFRWWLSIETIDNENRIQLIFLMTRLEIYLEIFIYLVLAISSILTPILSLWMGLDNIFPFQNLSLSLRHIRTLWYKSTEINIFIYGLLHIPAFLILYWYYFPNLTNLQDYVEVRPVSKYNLMHWYYFITTFPMTLHILYVLCTRREETIPENSVSSILMQSAQTTAQTGSELSTEEPQKSKKQEHLDLFCAHYNISKRETDILLQLIEGKSYAAMAECLYISLATVKSHIHSIYRKTGVRNKAQLILKILKSRGVDV